MDLGCVQALAPLECTPKLMFAQVARQNVQRAPPKSCARVARLGTSCIVVNVERPALPDITTSLGCVISVLGTALPVALVRQSARAANPGRPYWVALVWILAPTTQCRSPALRAGGSAATAARTARPVRTSPATAHRALITLASTSTAV